MTQYLCQEVTTTRKFPKKLRSTVTVSRSYYGIKVQAVFSERRERARVEAVELDVEEGELLLRLRVVVALVGWDYKLRLVGLRRVTFFRPRALSHSPPQEGQRFREDWTRTLLKNMVLP